MRYLRGMATGADPDWLGHRVPEVVEVTAPAAIFEVVGRTVLLYFRCILPGPVHRQGQTNENNDEKIDDRKIITEKEVTCVCGF